MKLFNKKSKYDIDPKDNMPREVYGVPFPTINIFNKKKLDIKPEDNVPQIVYGIPDKNMYLSKCPYCGSTELWEYIYGSPNFDYDKDKYILASGEITDNQPRYKCKKCNKDLYL